MLLFCFLTVVGEKWTFLENQYLRRMMQWRYALAIGHPTVIFKPVDIQGINGLLH